AGLKAGDEVVRVDGIVNPTRKQFMLYIRNHPGEAIPIVVDRDGQRIATTVTPVQSLNYHYARIGIESDPGRVLSSRSRGVFGSIAAAGSQIAEVTKQTVLSLGKVFGPQGIGRMFDLVFGNAQRTTGDAVGSVGVASAAGQITQAFGFGALLFLLAGVNVF